MLPARESVSRMSRSPEIPDRLACCRAAQQASTVLQAVCGATDARVLSALAGVDKRSADTWMHPALFHMQYSTGAPPDMFDAGGQNWGFPTYNWEEMAKDNYQWWRRRLTTLSECAIARRRPGPSRASACTSTPAWHSSKRNTSSWGASQSCGPCGSAS